MATAAIGPTLKLTPKELVTIRHSTADVLEVEATYGPGGSPPPPHLHPRQDERFEVLAGTLRVKIDGQEAAYGPGESFDVPRGTAHQMWNPGDRPARVIWQTTPAGRTHEWWLALDSLQRSGKVDAKGMPSPPAMGVLLTHYRDVFELAVGPRPLVQGALAALGVLGRVRGYRPAGRDLAVSAP
jgi:mannose-6-phosphate isomerase-like protein (cupin superfamily)